MESERKARASLYAGAGVIAGFYRSALCGCLAALRSAMERAGKPADRIEPLIPVDLVIDHSVRLDDAGMRLPLS